MDSSTTKVPRPDYRPWCLRDLEHVLGAADAVMEWTEVGARNLKREQDAHGPSRVEQIATLCHIKVNAFDWPVLAQRLACLEVVSVCQHLEWFLDRFRREHPRPVRQRSSDEDLVSYTLKAYGVSEAQAGLLECRLIDYYRRARNLFIHDVTSAQKKKDDVLASSLRADVVTSRYCRLVAPNPLAGFCFDDFLLLSRATKNFARLLCDNAAPTLAEIQGLLTSDPEFLRQFRCRAGNRRLPEALTRYVERRFGLSSLAPQISRAILADGTLA